MKHENCLPLWASEVIDFHKVDWKPKEPQNLSQPAFTKAK